jgi:hypothetical protein
MFKNTGRNWFILNFIVTSVISGVVSGERDASKRISANIPGDFIIGALFSLHHPPSQKRTGSGQFLACGQVGPNQIIDFFIEKIILS